MVQIAHLGVASELTLFCPFYSKGYASYVKCFSSIFCIQLLRGSCIWNAWCPSTVQHCALAESIAKRLLVYSRSLFCAKSELTQLCVVCSEEAVIETSRVAFLRVEMLQLYREWPSNQHGWVLYSGLLDCWFMYALIAPEVVLKCCQNYVWDQCSFYANWIA